MALISHRLLAYRGENIDQIEAEVFESDDDMECRLESIRRNSRHGKQLTSIEKKSEARDLYELGCPEPTIMQALSISERTLRGYLNDIKAKENESRNQKILELYLACHTQDEIAKEVGIDTKETDRDIINRIKGEIGSSAEIAQAPTSLQHTNLWEFSSCDPEYGEKNYPGRLYKQDEIVRLKLK